jgi:DNA-binding NarL/FixJ family response regulator
VLILGSVRLYREGLAALLTSETRAKIATASPDELAMGDDAEVVIVDGTAGDAVDIVRAVINLLPRSAVLVVAAPHDEQEIVAHVESGASGFVEADATVGELAAAVASLRRGDALCSPRIGGILVRRVSSVGATPHLPPLPELTARERDVVNLIAEGLSNKQIASRLVIEVATVKNHVHNILEKLQVNGRTEAAARVHRADLAGTPRI